MVQLEAIKLLLLLLTLPLPVALPVPLPVPPREKRGAAGATGGIAAKVTLFVGAAAAADDDVEDDASALLNMSFITCSISDEVVRLAPDAGTFRVPCFGVAAVAFAAGFVLYRVISNIKSPHVTPGSSGLWSFQLSEFGVPNVKLFSCVP